MSACTLLEIASPARKEILIHEGDDREGHGEFPGGGESNSDSSVGGEYILDHDEDFF